jgi:hypothetical protein
MSKGIAIAAAIVLALGIGAWKMLTWNPSNTFAAPAELPAPLPAPAPTTQLPDSTGKPPRLPAQVAAAGPKAEFAFQRDCLTFARFSALLSQQAKDPDSALNNPAKLSELPPRQQQTFTERVALVKRMSSSCPAWNSQIPPAQAARMAYDSALQLGLRGDTEAAACFVMTAWEQPSEQSAEGRVFEQQYRQNARRLADAGIARGSWTTALAAYNATRRQHGVSPSIGYSQTEQYQLARLLQMGTADPELAASLADEAALLRAGLDANVIASADARARTLFDGPFQGDAMSDDDIRKNCGN